MLLLPIEVKMISLINYTETNFLKFIKNTSTATLTDQELIAAYKKSSDMNFLGALYIPKKYQLQNTEVPQIIRLEEDKMSRQELAYFKKKSASSKTALIKEDNIK